MKKINLILCCLLISISSFSQSGTCEYNEPSPIQISNWEKIYLTGYYHCYDVPHTGNSQFTQLNEDFDTQVWGNNNGLDGSWYTYWKTTPTDTNNDNQPDTNLDPNNDGVYDHSQFSRSHACQSCIFKDENVISAVYDNKTCAKLIAKNHIEEYGDSAKWGLKTVPYTCSTLKGDFGLNIGEYRANIKLPELSRLWTNFWTFHKDEIDIAEYFSSSLMLHNYYPGDNNSIVKFQKKCDPVGVGI